MIHYRSDIYHFVFHNHHLSVFISYPSHNLEPHNCAAPNHSAAYALVLLNAAPEMPSSTTAMPIQSVQSETMPVLGDAISPSAVVAGAALPDDESSDEEDDLCFLPPPVFASVFAMRTTGERLLKFTVTFPVARSKVAGMISHSPFAAK